MKIYKIFMSLIVMAASFLSFNALGSTTTSTSSNTPIVGTNLAYYYGYGWRRPCGWHGRGCYYRSKFYRPYYRYYRPYPYFHRYHRVYCRGGGCWRVY